MWPNADTTQHLLLAAKGGSADAIDALLDRHRAALVRLISRRMDPALERRVDASDIVQDALIEAHRRLATYIEAPAMPFGLWLRHIARDRLIDAHRRHRVAARRSLDREQPLAAASDAGRSAFDLLPQAVDRELTPAAAASRNEQEALFWAAIDKMPEPDREVLLLRHFDQLTNQEVAQELGLSEPAAGMRYVRAMRKLAAACGVKEEEA
jgi:RNA polymerase sigma-70 factor (ECF subfamily)